MDEDCVSIYRETGELTKEKVLLAQGAMSSRLGPGGVSMKVELETDLWPPTISKGKNDEAAVDEDSVMECEIEHWTDVPDSVTHWVLSSNGCVVKSFSSDDGRETWHDTTYIYKRPDDEDSVAKGTESDGMGRCDETT